MVLTGDVPAVEDVAEVMSAVISTVRKLSSREPMLMTGRRLVGEEAELLVLTLVLLVPRIWRARRPLTRWLSPVFFKSKVRTSVEVETGQHWPVISRDDRDVEVPHVHAWRLQ